MFDNIGEKLIGLAYIQAILGIIGSIIGGLVFMFAFEGDMLLVGLLIIVGGSIVSWISSWITYAIGEIAINSAANPALARPKSTSTNELTPATLKAAASKIATTKTSANSAAKFCPHCGEKVRSKRCDMCGLENTYFN